jgi:nitrous oxide reductase accessory protein NosL
VIRKGLRISFLVGALLLAAAILPAQDDVTAHPACSICGMDREVYGHSRVLIVYDDGTVAATCSLRCAAVDMAAHIDKTPAVIRVGDYDTKRVLDAERAFWVVGGKVPGVMTARAKWAFETKEQAGKFRAENGGVPADFDQAMKAAFEDIYSDIKRTYEMRKRRRAGGPDLKGGDLAP